MFYEFTVVDLYSTVIHFLKQPMIYLNMQWYIIRCFMIYSSRSILNCITLFKTAIDIPKYAMVYYSMFYEFTVVDLYLTVIHFFKTANDIPKYAMVYYSMFYEFTVVDLYSTVMHFLKQPMIYLNVQWYIIRCFMNLQ